MSATTSPVLTVKAARRLLSNTLRQPPELIRQAEGLMRDLQSRRPGIMPGGGVGVATCANCGNANWSLHTDDDDEIWGCSACHRPDTSDAEARALRQARAEQAAAAAAEAARVAAAAPSLRAVLKATAAALLEARVEHDRIVKASTNAQEWLTAAQSALDSAQEALAAARERCNRETVAALLDPSASSSAKRPRTMTAETTAVEEARSKLRQAEEVGRMIADLFAEDAAELCRLEQRLHRAARDVVDAERPRDRAAAMAALLADPRASVS